MFFFHFFFFKCIGATSLMSHCTAVVLLYLGPCGPVAPPPGVQVCTKLPFPLDVGGIMFIRHSSAGQWTRQNSASTVCSEASAHPIEDTKTEQTSVGHHMKIAHSSAR